MDLDLLQQRVAAVEAAAHDVSVKHASVVHELDRLAEHLVGESSPEVQGVKKRIQQLITQVAPERSDVVRYVDIYCHAVSV